MDALTIVWATLLACLLTNDITWSGLLDNSLRHWDTRLSNSLMGTTWDVRASTRDLQSVSNNTICIPFDIVVFIDSSKAINLAYRTVANESKNPDLLSKSCPKEFLENMPYLIMVLLSSIAASTLHFIVPIGDFTQEEVCVGLCSWCFAFCIQLHSWRVFFAWEMMKVGDVSVASHNLALRLEAPYGHCSEVLMMQQ